VSLSSRKDNFVDGIKDKVLVITGASSGIGEAAAVMLAERGAKVVFGARGLDRLEALARRIAGAGGEVAYAQTDVRKRDDLTSLVNLACEHYGKLEQPADVDVGEIIVRPTAQS
jgi:NADP-dependent 3-hydroxy acid dehydrogenase YdfG